MVDITDDLKSKTALKNEAKDVHTFGKILVGLTDKQISQIELPENVYEAIKELKKKFGPKKTKPISSQITKSNRFIRGSTIR